MKIVGEKEYFKLNCTMHCNNMTSFNLHTPVFQCLICIVIFSQGLCGTFANCTFKDRIIRCINTPPASTDFLNEFVNEEVHMMYLQKGWRTSYHSGIFQDPKLRKNVWNLEISNSHRPVTIEDSTFHGFPQLRWLKLFGNHLTQIRPDMFNDVHNLEYLFLQNNDIESIGENFFTFGHMLQVINLSHNQIGTVDETAFKELFKLNSLYLDHNKISNFGEAIFSDLPKLKYLTLNSNNLTFVPKKLFEKLTVLVEVDLSDNPIKSLRYFFDILRPSVKMFKINGLPCTTLTSILIIDIRGKYTVKTSTKRCNDVDEQCSIANIYNAVKKKICISEVPTKYLHTLHPKIGNIPCTFG